MSTDRRYPLLKQPAHFDIASAEKAAQVTVINDAYQVGVVDRYATNTTPGVTDMTQAIKNALAQHQQPGGAPVEFLGTKYLASDTCLKLLNSSNPVFIRGVPLKTTILNKAGATKPTFQFIDSQYWDMRGIVFIGATGFPNVGVSIETAGGQRCAFFNIEDVVAQTNGGGIHIQGANTGEISNYQYWPSGGSSFGGTIDANGQPYGILADGTTAVNGIHLEKINVGGLNSIANGGCGVKIDGSASAAPFQDWKVDRLECESTGVRAAWLRNVNIAKLEHLFTENAEVRLDNACAGVQIQELEAAASGTLVIDGTQSLGGCTRTTLVNCQAKGITADSANSETVQINNIWAGATGNADASANRVQINVRTTGSVLQPDTYQPVWVTETFAAGNYTANTGNWTVAAGNELTREYLIQGKRATVNFHVTATSVSATPVFLFMALPAGMQSKKDLWVQYMYSEDNGATTKTGVAHLQTSSNQLALAKDLSSPAWATTASLTKISFSATFEIV